MNKKILLAVFGFFILLTLYSLRIPFFWDSTFFSALSVHFYENGFNGFIAEPNYDTGGFPLYSAYLTLVFKCFGKNLPVAHLAMLPFLAGIAWCYFQLAKQFLKPRTLILAMLLLVVEPVLLTQSILMGYDCVIACFFLFCLYALYANKRLLYAIGLIALCMISIRGIMLAAALFILDLAINSRFSFRMLLNYFPAAIILGFWIFYHEQQTGWYFFSPEREYNAEEFTGPAMMFRQFIYIIWKSLDLGHLTLWAVLLAGSIYLLRKENSGSLKKLLRTILVPLFVLTAFMLLIRNPIGHKYFLVVFLLLNLGVCYLIEQIKNKQSKRVVVAFILVSLIAGNFIVYPQRFGNAWDASLKILPYFSAEEEMNDYVKSSNIAPKEIGSQFPLTQDERYTKLSDKAYAYSDIENHSINQFRYFLYSNVINSGRMVAIEEIKRNWKEEKKISKGQVTLILYKNPDF